MRALGCNPTEQDITDIVNENVKDETGKIDEETFLTIMSKKNSEVDNTEEIKKAFDIFDKDQNGYISASELRHVLTTLGEKLTEPEVDDLLKEIVVQDGLINIEDFIKLITSK